MRLAILAVLSGLMVGGCPATGAVPVHSPRLLLSAQRLKRLKRDRDRQTPRWNNLANRIESVPDSPERGFELALYFAVTGDEAKGREAVTWARAHPCEKRQVALVKDWCADLITSSIPSSSCPADGERYPARLRDELINNAATGKDTEAEVQNDKQELINYLRSGVFDEPRQLYAAVEYLSVARTVERVDIREENRKFFSFFPIELLLSLKGEQVEHPDWLTHVSALALVSLDPNLDSSQFLQAWAIEDRQTIHEGPGVAYEFLWADPYLPGVGYQNLDPWLSDESRGLLVGREDWSSTACWIRISPGKLEEENCPEGWQDKPLKLGRLTLLPVRGTCITLGRQTANESVILWKLPPKRKLTYLNGKTQEMSNADSAGLWRVPLNAKSQVCLAP